MKNIIAVISIISIIWLLTSCGTTKKEYQTENLSIPTVSTNSEVSSIKDTSSVPEESKPSDNENTVSPKTESANNSVSINNSTSTEPSINSSTSSQTSVNNSTPKEPTVDKGPTKVDYNPNLTWEEAYVDNEDGTFQLTFVDGEVVTYVPHPTEEGTYRKKGNLIGGMGLTFETIKYIWDIQWCNHCGSCDPLHHRYGIDITCYDCGEMAKANTCHICGAN